MISIENAILLTLLKSENVRELKQIPKNKSPHEIETPKDKSKL